MMAGKSRRVAAAVIVALVAGAVWFGWRASQPSPITLTADFADTTGLYIGNEVQYLGVPIGHVTKIDPEGTYMSVHLEIDHDATIPRDAGAQIMQSALLTDRYVELGPAYTGGPMLTSGAHIVQAKTRSPINIDDLSRAVTQLVDALSTPGATNAQNSNVGQLVHALAGQMDGNGAKFHDMLVASQKALATLNTNSPDIVAITKNLGVLVTMLNERNQSLKDFGHGVAAATQALASQGPALAQTISAFAELTTQVNTFVKTNKSTLLADLRKAASVTQTISAEQADLAKIWDYMPTGAENIVRAYDPVLKAIRVTLALRGQTVFSSVMRSATCKAYLGNICDSLMNAQGTGPLDQLFKAAGMAIPETVR